MIVVHLLRESPAEYLLSVTKENENGRMVKVAYGIVQTNWSHSFKENDQIIWEKIDLLEERYRIRNQ